MQQAGNKNKGNLDIIKFLFYFLWNQLIFVILQLSSNLLLLKETNFPIQQLSWFFLGWNFSLHKIWLNKYICIKIRCGYKAVSTLLLALILMLKLNHYLFEHTVIV